MKKYLLVLFLLLLSTSANAFNYVVEYASSSTSLINFGRITPAPIYKNGTYTDSNTNVAITRVTSKSSDTYSGGNLI